MTDEGEQAARRRRHSQTEFAVYARFAREALRDINETINDFASAPVTTQIRFVVDSSEVFAYAHVTDPEKATRLRIFPDDSPSQLVGVQAAVLNQLLRPSDSARAPILLAPYHVELAGLVDALRADDAGGTALDLNAVLESWTHLTKSPAVQLALTRRREEQELSEDEMDTLVREVQKHGQALVWLVESPRRAPLERLVSFLRERTFSTLSDALNERIAFTEDDYNFWYTELSTKPPRGKSEAAIRLDAQALAILEQVSTRRSDLTLLLVSRSDHLLTTVRRVQEKHPEKHGVRVRHPRSLIGARIYGVGTCTALDEMNVRSWVNALELFVQSQETSHEIADRTVPKRLLDDARQCWSDLQNLVCGSYALERGSQNEDLRTKTERYLPEILATLDDDSRLRDAIVQKIASLEVRLAASYENLGVALQVPTPVPGQPEPTPPEVAEVDKGASFTIRLARMPYELEFESEDVRTWIRTFVDGGRDFQWREMLDLFRQTFMQEIGYERLLAMSYVFGSWGRWDLAEAYCRHAIVRGKTDRVSSYHQGLVFLAVCLRMPRDQTFAHYRQGLAYLDEAVHLKKSRLGIDDARAHREAAAIVLLWRYRSQIDDAHRGQKDVPELAVAERESELALRASDVTDLLRAEVHGNLCFYYLASPKESDADRASFRFKAAMSALRKEFPDDHDWPPQFLDLYGWGTFVLRGKSELPISNEELEKLTEYVRRAVAQFIANPFRRRLYKQHLKTMRDELRNRTV